MDNKLNNIINALDGKLPATEKEAELIMNSGCLPFDEFIIKAETEAAEEEEQTLEGK